MSLRASASFPSTCSGAMYWMVPGIVPCAVPGNVARSVIPDSEMGVAGALNLARPKSSSFAPAFVSMMLAGLTSRSTMPARCARSSAAAIWLAHASACSSGSGPLSRRVASVSPSRCSSTRTSTARPSAARCRPMSCNVQMCGWFSAATARASRSKRSRACASAAIAAGSTLIATLRSSRESRARYTSLSRPPRARSGSHTGRGACRGSGTPHHFLRSAGQLTTTSIGGGAGSTHVLIRNRRPSAVTA